MLASRLRPSVRPSSAEAEGQRPITEIIDDIRLAIDQIKQLLLELRDARERADFPDQPWPPA